MKRLELIPELGQPQITIAVYNFPDKTGQRKPNTKFSQLSTAVTQGPEVWVINGLKAVGGHNPWFIVLEREGLDALIKENKRFSFMILPGQRHGFGSMSEYFFWLKADFFSKHFLDKKDFSVDMNIINQDIPQN